MAAAGTLTYLTSSFRKPEKLAVATLELYSTVMAYENDFHFTSPTLGQFCQTTNYNGHDSTSA